MQVSVKKKGNLGRVLTITVPKEEVASKAEGRLKRIRKTAKLPGFRPGKVPMNLVRSRYEGQALQEAAGELVEINYREAIQKEELNPAGQAQIDMEKFGPDEDLVFTADVELVPEVTSPSIKGKKVEVVETKIAKADVDRTIENILKQYATWEEVKTAAKEGERVTLDYSTEGEDLPESGMEGKDVQVVVGNGQVVDDFDKGIKGLKAGDEKSFDVTFPKDYGHEQLQNKKVKFSVKASKIETQILPELSEEFLGTLGLKDASEKGMRAEVQMNLERELEERLSNAKREATFETLLQENDFEVPQVMIDQEARQMVAQLKQQANQEADGTEDLTPFQEQAARRVKLSLLIGEYIRAEEIVIDDERVQGRINSLAETYDDPEEYKEWAKNDPQQMNAIRASVMESQVVDKLLEDAKVTPIKKSFQDFVEGAS